MKSTRSATIDVGRSTAIVGMVLVHFVVYLSGELDSYSTVTWTLGDVVGSFGAPGFVFLVGLSFHFACEAKEGPGFQGACLRRALALFVVGVASQGLSYLDLAHLFDWDILTFIAASLAVLSVVRRLPSSVLLGIALAMAAASVPLREWASYDQYWVRGDFEPVYVYSPDPIHNLVGFLVTGYFPVFPWLFFPLAGFVVARGLYGGRRNMLPLLWTISGICFAVSFVPLAFGSSGPDVTFYPLSSLSLARQFGIVLAIFCFLYWTFDSRGRAAPAWVTRFSRFSLSVYIYHRFAVLWPVILMDNMGKAVAEGWAIALAILFLAAVQPVILLWDRTRGLFSAEWLIASLSRVLPPHDRRSQGATS